MTPTEITVPRLPPDLLRRHGCHEPTDNHDCESGTVTCAEPGAAAAPPSAAAHESA